jgi:hypothetical protein
VNARIVVTALALTLPVGASTEDTPLASAEDFIRETNEQYEELLTEGAAAAWAYQTYITPDTALLAARAQERGLKFQSSAVQGAKRYDGIELAPLTQRAINTIKWGTTLPAPDNDAKRRELEDRLRSARSPYPRAESFAVHELIDPRETRPVLCRWIDWIQPRLDELKGPTRFPMRP